MAKNPNVPTTLGVPGSAVSHATIKQGSKGADVTAWQTIIGVTADGNFGTGTTAATKKWQTAHGLTADGVVGPKSWSAAIGAPVQEAASGGISSGAPITFVPAPAASAPFSPVVQAPKASPGQSPKTTPAVVPASVAAITASPAAHTALKIAIPVVAVATGGWLFGAVGAIIGGALGLFGSSKV